MKKTSFIFILIFSVFFSYKIANASTLFPSSFDGAWWTVNNCVSLLGSTAQSYEVFYQVGGSQGTANTLSAPNACNSFQPLPTSFFSDAYATDGSPTPPWTWRIEFYDSTGGGGTNIGHSVMTYDGSQWEADGGVIPPDTQGTYNESPYNGEVVSTSGTGDVLVAFDYYLDTEQDPDHDTAEWCMRLVRNDGAGNVEFCDDVAFDTYTEVSHTFTGLPLDSQWDWSIIFTRPGFFIDEYSILHGGSNYFFAGRFTIDSTVEEIYTAYTTCSITDLAGCFQNAIVFLFYPSQSSLNDFSNLYDAIKNKPPFGYISAVQTALQGINDTETSAFTLETMPILDTYIFTPVRTALIWIMWLAFIFMFYHRLKNIHL